MKLTIVNRRKEKMEIRKRKQENRENHGNQSSFLEMIIKIDEISTQTAKNNKEREYKLPISRVTEVTSL